MADGTTQVSNIDLGSADRIEVLRGPSAVLYGNSAGGAITIRTETPPVRPIIIQPDVQFGSDGYQRQQVKASGTARGVGYLVSASRIQTDGFRRHSRAEVRQANALLVTALSAHGRAGGLQRGRHAVQRESEHPDAGGRPGRSAERASTCHRSGLG